MIDNLRSLTLEQKIGQLFFIGVPGPEADGSTRELLSEISPGGICLFARNIREAAQTRQLLDDIRAFVPIEPLLSIDQEGGLVDRLRRVMTPMPAASAISSVEGARELAEIIGETLGVLGFNMDFAPVVDVIDAERAGYTNGLVSRTFGLSHEDTTLLAAEFLTVLQSIGITGCIKHFPGLGASRVDSHEQLPLVDIDEAQWRSVDLYPYTSLIASGAVRAIMVAHASFPKLDLQERGQNGTLLPSSLSYNIVTSLLRRELRYGDLVITDDLEMGAIKNNYGIGEACKMAIAAGVDMLAICADPAAIREGYHAVLDAARTGVISTERIDQSLDRIAKAKSYIAPPPDFDSDRLLALSDRVVRLAEHS